MTFKPTPPVIISGSGSSGGSSISNPDSEVSVNVDGNGDSFLLFKTGNETAMTIDSIQSITMGSSTNASQSKLRIIDDFGKCITLVNSLNDLSANMQIDTNGLSFIVSNNNVRFGTSRLHIQNGNLYISDVQVLSTADQLNYTNISTAGMAFASKALVVDINKDIIGINELTATQLSGTLMTPSQPNITTLNSIDITSGLSLAGSMVNASANELNYLYNTTAGTITANKAFVFDATKNLVGINRLDALTLSGTLEDSSQPAITSVGTLTDLNTSGYIGIGTTTPSTHLEIKGTTPTITLNNDTSTASISMSNDSLYLTSGNELVISGNTRLLNKSLSGITSLTANTLTGTLQTATQTNITSVGSLDSLDVIGDVNIGRQTTTATTYRLIIKEQNGMLIQLRRSDALTCSMSIGNTGDLVITPTRDIVLTSALTISGSLSGITDLSANTITGTLQTAAQPNITSVGTLGSLTITNGISADSLTSNTLSGTLLTSAQPNITSVGTLSSLAVTNGITSNSLISNTLTGTLQTANQPNITTTGTLTKLLSTAPLGIGIAIPTSVIDINTTDIDADLIISMTDGTNSSSISTDTNGVTLNMSGEFFSLGASKSLKFNGGTIVGLNALSANTITGTLQTAAQPNITSVGILGSLVVTNGISADSLTSNTLTGTLQTAAQPNITSVGTLGSLAVTNGISADSLTSNTLTGTLQTANQPNITTTGTLTKLLSTAPLGIGVVVPTSAIDINTTDISTNLAINMTDGTNSSTISTNISGLLLDTSGEFISLGASKSLKFNGGTINGLQSLTVSEITGTLLTSNQPNITHIGTLDYLDTTYIGLGIAHSTSYRINVLDSSGTFSTFSNGTNSMTISVIDSNYTINTTNNKLALHTNVDLVLNGGTIIGLDSLVANALTGTIQTAAQPNITSVGNLTQLTVLASIQTAGVASSENISAPTMYIDETLTVIGNTLVSTIDIGTSFTLGTTTMNQTDLDNLIVAAYRPQTPVGVAGTVEANKVLMPDTNKNLSAFNDLTAINLYGAIKDAYQPLITTVGTLQYLNTIGDIGIGTETPNKKLEISSISGDCLRLTNATANISSDITVDSSGNLIMTPSLTVKTNSMMIGNASANQIPMEVGYAAFTMTNPYSYRTNIGATGIMDPVSAPVSYNYSIRALGRILCTGSIDVMSDRRVKTNIEELTDDYCTDFIARTTPVRYNRIGEDNNEYFGYIAQELVRAGFQEVVNLVPDDSMEEEIDEDGYISPEGMAYNISYEHIIPILAKNQKRLMDENRELKNKIDQIMELLNNHN